MITSSNRELPRCLQAPSIRTLNDIYLDRLDPEGHLWCAFYGTDIKVRDKLGREYPAEHTFSGTSTSRHSAQFLCMMEAAERVSGLSSEVVAALSFRGGTGPHWSSFSPYSSEQLLNAQSVPEEDWRVWASGITSGCRIAVPSVSVFPWWKSFSCERYHLPEGDGAGFAAGFSWEYEALKERALREVVERDSVMLSWRIRSWPVQVLPHTILPFALARVLSVLGLSVELYDVGRPTWEPVIVAIVSRDDSKATLGASCHPDVGWATQKAVYEALMLRGTAEIAANQRKSIHVDTIQDSLDHLLYHWENSQPLLDWYRSKGQKFVHRSSRVTPLHIRCMKEFGTEPLLIDVTHPELTEWNIRVIRILQSNAMRKEYRHSCLYAGGQIGRMLQLRPENVNLAPHPIA